MSNPTTGRAVWITGAAVLIFTLLHQARILDSRQVWPDVLSFSTSPAATLAGPLRFTATAYCKGSVTAAGVAPRAGIAAADPGLLPVGSIIQTTSLGAAYDGIYTVLDTGPRIQGRKIDLYIWSCHEALRFGSRITSLNILRLGWNPRATAPDLVGELFRQREATLREPIQATPHPGTYGPVTIPVVTSSPE